jgi:hypothetical protein
MTTVVLIHGEPLIIPTEREPYHPGDKLSLRDAKLLNLMHFKRWSNALNNWYLRNQARDLSHQEILNKSNEIYQSVDLLSPEDGSNPIFDEAMSLARDLICRHLAAESLPIPPTLDEHAEVLVSSNPSILTQAKIRLEARQRAATETAQALGIEGIR